MSDLNEVQAEDSALSYGERQELVVTIRRRVYAAMETGNPQVARTLLVELAEFDAKEAYKLRANVVRDYGTDI